MRSAGAHRLPVYPGAREESRRGRVDSALSNWGQGDVAGGNEAQRCRQHGLDADCPGLAFGEGQAFHLDVLRIVIRDDDVDEAGGHALDQRLAVLLPPQRRRQFEEGAVVADVVLVQRQNG